MSGRKTPIVTGEYYHVFNHGIDYRNICTNKHEYERFLLTIWFYQPLTIQVKLSHYLSLAQDVQQQLIDEINKKPKLIELHAFSLMPDHYHLVIKQLVDNGISTFIGNIQNSFSKYYNAKHERLGSLFISPFHATRIHNEMQYLHVCRYTHLNRFSSGLIKSVDSLLTDPYSSLPYYFQTHPIAHQLVYTQQLESLFSNPKKHWQFITDHADYQRSLEHIKHLVIE